MTDRSGLVNLLADVLTGCQADQVAARRGPEGVTVVVPQRDNVVDSFTFRQDGNYVTVHYIRLAGDTTAEKAVHADRRFVFPLS